MIPIEFDYTPWNSNSCRPAKSRGGGSSLEILHRRYRPAIPITIVFNQYDQHSRNTPDYRARNIRSWSNITTARNTVTLPTYSRAIRRDAIPRLSIRNLSTNRSAPTIEISKRRRAANQPPAFRWRERSFGYRACQASAREPP